MDAKVRKVYNPLDNNHQTPWNIFHYDKKAKKEKWIKFDDFDSGLIEKHYLVLRDGDKIKTIEPLHGKLNADLSNLNMLVAYDIKEPTKILKLR